ncbi:MAG: response regulator [Helicobacteraceae bacterium]|nr:response regulator [Helicobacteraceae bacterium]
MSSLKSKYTILCVDDNANNLFTINALLSTLDSVKTKDALGAKEALDILLTQHIDLILCDVQMPDINGFELAKMIKSNKKTKDIPIIFVTAVFKSEEFIKQGFQLGAVDYITKPIDDNQLLNKLNLYLKIFTEKEKVLQSEKRLFDIAQSIGNGIYTLDTDYNTTFINNEALTLLGFKESELLGKCIHDYIHYKDINNNQILSKDCCVHQSMLANNICRNENEYLVKKDGTFLPVSIVTTPLSISNEVVGTVAVFTDKSNQNKISLLEHEKLKNQEQMIHSMIDMIESRDSYTAGHTKRVAYYCKLIAQEMNFSNNDVELLQNAAWLHDIGKISTPDSVLLKPGNLDKREYSLIQEHLNSGFTMLNSIDQYKEIASVMREHHEKYDGSGYPRGLIGDEIKPLSKIMIVADAFDAMTTNRVYKPKKSIEVALKELESLSAIHFHPNVVHAAKKVLKNINIDEEISQLPTTEIEEQRFAYFYKDRLTNLFIIDYMELILRYYVKTKDIYTYDIKLHHFSAYNKKFGWKSGDCYLINFSEFLNNIDKKSVVFRVEGDDFMILSESKIESIESKIKEYINNTEKTLACSVEEKFIEDVHNNMKSLLQIV